MNKSLLSAAMLLSGLAVVGSAHAAGTATATLDVSAMVGMACSVTTSPVNFGFVDAWAGGTTTGSITVTCTPGMFYTVALDAGQNFNGNRRISDGAGSFMDYYLWNPLTGLDWGDDSVTNPGASYSTTALGTGTTSYTVNGDLPGGTSVANGAYSDVVSVTVTY